MKRKGITGIVTMVVAFCVGFMQIPTLAAGQHHMYSRYDGAAIMVNDGEESSLAQGYANPDETITVYSRVDGAPVVLWSYEVAEKQEYYATGAQNIRMFSKYDGAMITVHSYEAARYSAAYYGEKETVTIYSMTSGASYIIWASELAAYLNVGYSTTRPYIPVYAYTSFSDIPSFGSMMGMTDVWDDFYYTYVLSSSTVEAVNRYKNELRQWGFRYYATKNDVAIYYNETHLVGVTYVDNIVFVAILN